MKTILKKIKWALEYVCYTIIDVLLLLAAPIIIAMLLVFII